ncbi:MAG: AraC family transcriptional regulator [Frondihabitans sp.]|nr:AraC family transcriptional regulator [Frondihabitans sp.]
MSPARHAAFVFDTFPLEKGQTFDDHVHDRHQLAWVREGVLMITIGERHWVLPPHLALWIPAGTWHTTTALKTVMLHGIYLSVEAEVAQWREPTVVSVSPLLRELIPYFYEELTPDARGRAEALLRDLLTPVTTVTIDLPLPRDERAARIAAQLSTEPADDRDLDAWGRTVGASTRTLSRIFASETGLGFLTWRTRLRLRAALAFLADGDTVSQAAARVGYSSPSAFVASFRRVTGQTPGSYFAQDAAPR